MKEIGTAKKAAALFLAAAIMSQGAAAVSAEGIGGMAGAGSYKSQRVELNRCASSLKSVSLSWSAIDGSNGYKLYRKKTGGKWKLVRNFKQWEKDNQNCISYTDKGVKRHTKYYYKVKAYKKSGGRIIYTKASYPCPTHTWTANKKLYKAYEEMGQGYLTYSPYSRNEFLLADANADGVPELYLKHKNDTPMPTVPDLFFPDIFTYKNGKVESFAREQGHMFKYYPNKGVFAACPQHMSANNTISYYKYKNGGGAKLIAKKDTFSMDPTTYYNAKGKKISKKKFKKILKKYVGKTKARYLPGYFPTEYLSNIPENYRSYLK